MAKNPICNVDGCDKPSLRRGWCSAHYTRWRRHGDPLGGGTHNGEPLRYFNDVVLAYEGDECLTWPYSKISNGYGNINGQLVHRMVCEEVNGPPPTPKHDAAHSCGRGNLACVTKRHLSWKTRKENMADKLSHGTHQRGEKANGAKLTEPEVRQIIALKGLPLPQIAEKFGVTVSNVWAIQRGKSWAWLD